MVIGNLAIKAGEKILGKSMDRRKSFEQSQKEAQTSLNDDYSLPTLATGEETIVNFRSASKDSTLRSFYPFESIDVYNPEGELLEVYVNQKDDLLLPIQDGQQNGDSFEDTGIYSLRFKNPSSNSGSIDLSNCTIVVSGNPKGVARSG